MPITASVATANAADCQVIIIAREAFRHRQKIDQLAEANANA